MRIRGLWLGLIMLLALPIVGSAQHPRGGESSKGLNGAVEKLLEHRVRLEMTSDQLARVQAIKDTADARKQPLWQQVMAVRRDLKTRQKAQPEMPAAEKAALVERSGAEIERLLDQIRGVDHAAMREVGEVLSPQQKEMVRDMVRGNQGDRNRSDGSRGRGNGRD